MKRHDKVFISINHIVTGFLRNQVSRIFNEWHKTIKLLL